MPGNHILEIPLPDGNRLSPFDLDLLKATLIAIVQQRFECSEQSQKSLCTLEQQGWHVRLGPTWLAVARRGESVEQATGSSPDEAVARLYEYARHETGFGCP